MSVSIDIPVIETERLILRGFEVRDLDDFADMSADEDTMKFVGGRKTRFESWNSMTAALGHWVLRGFGMFAVEEKSSGRLIGIIGPLFPDGWPENEIGYILAKHAHGKCYATEAAVASLKYAYQELGWTTAISLIDADNAASQNVARKLGAAKVQANVQVTDFVADIWRHLPPQEFMEKHG